MNNPKWKYNHRFGVVQMLTTNEDQTTVPRCTDCKWVHEADSVKGTSFMGVELCPKHAAAPAQIEKLLKIHDKLCADYRVLLSKNTAMLEALQEISNEWPYETPALPADHVRKIARAAIAKAEGK